MKYIYHYCCKYTELFVDGEMPSLRKRTISALYEAEKKVDNPTEYVNFEDILFNYIQENKALLPNCTKNDIQVISFNFLHEVEE